MGLSIGARWALPILPHATVQLINLESPQKKKRTRKCPNLPKRNLCVKDLPTKQLLRIYCYESYDDPPIKEWIQCNEWAHEECTAMDCGDSFTSAFWRIRVYSCTVVVKIVFTQFISLDFLVILKVYISNLILFNTDSSFIILWQACPRSYMSPYTLVIHICFIKILKLFKYQPLFISAHHAPTGCPSCPRLVGHDGHLPKILMCA